MIGYVYDPFMALHKDAYSHLECPERIHVIYQKLLKKGYIGRMHPVKSRYITLDELLMAHSKSYLTFLESHCGNPFTSKIEERYDDVYANSYTFKCAKLAAGSTVELATQVASPNSPLTSGIAIVRPPGHHAGISSAGGFCFLNNVAIAAKVLKSYVNRILIFDFDVHHGNGTEEIVKGDSQILFVSIHRYDRGDFYPGTGSDSMENIINVPLEKPTKGDSFYLGLLVDMYDRLKNFQPDIILISAGFDAAKGDPLGGYKVTPDGYYKMIKILKTMCPKIVLVLEGGYNLKSIANSASECVRALMDS